METAVEFGTLIDMSFKIGNGQASVDSATTLGACEPVVIMLFISAAHGTNP